MTDRELLELAAKAAGIVSDGCGTCFDMEREATWNPLENDGDALRLAVKLHIEIDYQAPDYRPHWTTVATERSSFNHMASETGDDPYAATRRAIVRVAAEIGRNMK
jgi:hypothetical protein